MKKHLDKFYSAYGDRGVMFLLYALSVVINSIMSVSMELPAILPDEIGVASIAAYYTGHDWSGVMSELGCYYGYIQAIFYAPLFLLFGTNPLALYKSMLVMNGVLVSFIPPLAYHLAAKLNVEKVWQKVIIAVCSGGYVTYVAHSKFIWNEAICSLLPWALIWCAYIAWDRKNRYSRFTMSVMSGFLCAVCYAANQRLVTVVIAFALTIIIFRLVFKEKILNITVTLMTAAASFITEYFFRLMVQNAVWRDNQQLMLIDSESIRPEMLTVNSLNSLVSVVCGHLYTFFTSTLGLGAIALVLLVVLIVSAIKDGVKNRAAKKNAATGEDGTKEYTAPARTFSIRIMLFGVYSFLAIALTLTLSAFQKCGSENAAAVQDVTIFGRFVDSTAPLAVFFVLVFMFRYGLKLWHVFSAAGVYAFFCAIFALGGYQQVSQGEIYRESAVMGLLPWRIGEELSAPLTGMSFVIMSSCVFSAFVMMIVLISCTKHHSVAAISVVMCASILYTTLFVYGEYLPLSTEENAEKTAAAQSISQLVYNDKQSPVIAAYFIPSRTAAMVQFLNPMTSVEIVYDKKDIPENCILITEMSRSVPFEKGTYDVVGLADGYAVYAYGSSARDFISFKANS